MRCVRLLVSGVAAVVLLNVGSAGAAPQILGIVASNGAVPLACGEESCHADLSTFCLQQPRANPQLGQRYDLADADKVTLVGTAVTGETVRLPAAPFVSFATARGFTSVEVTMPAATMARLGLAAVAVEVAPAASLVPAVAVGDPDPQSDDEVALALGAYRQQGSKYFDESGEAADAIRLTNRMINDLPKHKRHATDTDGHLTETALQSDAAMVADPAGIKLAQRYHDTCIVKVDVTHHIDSMRTCLQGTHDRLVTNTNIDFWRSLSSY
jgi:hypothetical protein